MIYVALGSTEAIGASCHFLKINGTGIVLDAGADPDHEGVESLPRLDLLRDHPDWYVDHALITHAHHDHIGSLPVLIQQFPHVLVHMTRPTRELAEFILPASARLQRRKLREGSTVAEPLFGEEELEMYSYLYLTHELEKSFDVTGLKGAHPVKAQFYSSGHILGSAGVLLTYTEDGTERRIFYTSDTNLRSQSVIPGGDYPEAPVDVLFLESTLGADPEAELTTRRTEEKKLGEALERVLGRGGSVLLPVFALGRAQEILALIDRYKDRGLIDPDIPVYTAGSLRAVSDVYDRTRFVSPRLNPEFQVFGVDQKRLPRSDAAKQDIIERQGIFVVSSGMMFERTISNRLAQMLVEDEKNGIFLVGYATEESPAHHLLEAVENGAEEVVLNRLDGPQPLRCEVDRFRFSGHSHRRDLIQLVERMEPKTVVLVHGDEPAREWMADNIRFFYPHVDVVLPALGEPVRL